MAAALTEMSLRQEALPPGSRSLLEAVRRVVDFAGQALETRWNITESFPEPGRELTRSITCDDFSHVLRELSKTLIPALRGSTATSVPVEMDALLKSQVEAIQSPAPAVVMFASAAYNYSIQYYPDPLVELGPLIAPGQALPSTSNQRFLFLSLPELERDSALLHTILVGHEIGHYRDWSAGVTDGLPLTLPAAWMDATGTVKPEYVKVQALYLQLAVNWAQEIVSDVFAAVTLGPASLLALMELLSSASSLTADSMTHPAGDRRLFLILKVLELRGFRALPEVEVFLHGFDTYSSRAEARDITLDQPLDTFQQQATSEAWAWLRTTLPHVVTSCLGHVPHAMEPTVWPTVLKAAARLQTGRPAGEVRMADDSLAAIGPDVILNAGWLTRVEAFTGLAGVLGVDQTPKNIAALGTVMDGLILKSIETASMRPPQ